MTSLWIMLPATLGLALVLLVLVVRATLRGEYDDWEGPALRMIDDDDTRPEEPGDPDAPE